MYDKGYILKYKFEDDNKQGLIKIALKYDASTKLPVIQSLERVSRPGLRTYAKPDDFKKIPGSPVSYWASENTIRAFGAKKISDVAVKTWYGYGGQL